MFTKDGCGFVKLNVSAAFHSRYMKNAQQKFSDFIRSKRLNPPSVPVISNVTARPYGNTEEDVKKKIVDQLASSVRWLDSVCYLLSEGADELSRNSSYKVV